MVTKTSARQSKGACAVDLTADEIRVHAHDFNHPWWQLANWLVNGWIGPGEFIACVQGSFSGNIGPLTPRLIDRESRTFSDAADQVRGNLAYYKTGYVVTADGATEITAGSGSGPGE